MNYTHLTEDERYQIYEEWFVEHGYLDERPPLSDAELYLAAMSAAQASGGAENCNEETVTMLVGSLEAGVHASRKMMDAN